MASQIAERIGFPDPTDGLGYPSEGGSGKYGRRILAAMRLRSFEFVFAFIEGFRYRGYRKPLRMQANPQNLRNQKLNLHTCGVYFKS